jgi:predicted dienelactone hydrolase
VLAALVAVTAGALVPAAATVRAAGPATTRAFAVGTRTETFVDTTRPTMANGTYPGSPTRTLPTLILYPARGRPGPGDVPEAPPASGRFPLILFSHGISSDGPAYEPLLRQWVTAGYVVAAPTYPLSNGHTPGGSATVSDFPHQAVDVSFVITSVLALNRDPRRRFHDVIDPSKIAAVGHSLGAVTTLGASVNSCCADRRIRATVSISGIEVPFNGSFFTGRPVVPLLLFHGTADGTVPYPSSQRLFADAPSPKYFVTLDGAPHTFFRQAATADHPPTSWEPVLVRSVLDFLARYLRAQRAGLVALRTDANVPGVASLQVG